MALHLRRSVKMTKTLAVVISLAATLAATIPPQYVLPRWQERDMRARRDAEIRAENERVRRETEAENLRQQQLELEERLRRLEKPRRLER